MAKKLLRFSAMQVTLIFALSLFLASAPLSAAEAEAGKESISRSERHEFHRTKRVCMGKGAYYSRPIEKYYDDAGNLVINDSFRKPVSQVKSP